MKTDIGKFKEQVSHLLIYMREITGGDPAIEKLKIKVNTAMTANPREVILLFTESITYYADEILMGNDSFFLEKTNYTKNIFNDIINNLKDLWLTLNPEQKETIVRYFKLLVVIGCIISKNEELRDIINKYRDTPITFDE